MPGDVNVAIAWIGCSLDFVFLDHSLTVATAAERTLIQRWFETGAEPHRPLAD